MKSIYTIHPNAKPDNVGKLSETRQKPVTLKPRPSTCAACGCTLQRHHTGSIRCTHDGQNLHFICSICIPCATSPNKPAIREQAKRRLIEWYVAGKEGAQ